MEYNKIYNLDCIEFMKKNDMQVDNIITSPPYNTSRKGSSLDNIDNPQENIRYDMFDDCRSNDEYAKWTCEIFDVFDKILKENGCILYNMSYSSENTECMFLTIAEIIRNTNFTIAGDIVWKKKSASPDSCSPNKLTRICEHIFVFCRKNEFKTFKSNKKISSKRKSGQSNYENVTNFIEAPNNDETCKIHKATYSSNLVRKLINMYVPTGGGNLRPIYGNRNNGNRCYKRKKGMVRHRNFAPIC